MIVIKLVGESGAGKSTWLQAFRIYAAGGLTPASFSLVRTIGVDFSFYREAERSVMIFDTAGGPLLSELSNMIAPYGDKTVFCYFLDDHFNFTEAVRAFNVWYSQAVVAYKDRYFRKHGTTPDVSVVVVGRSDWAGAIHAEIAAYLLDGYPGWVKSYVALDRCSPMQSVELYKTALSCAGVCTSIQKKVALLRQSIAKQNALQPRCDDALSYKILAKGNFNLLPDSKICEAEEKNDEGAKHQLEMVKLNWALP